MSKWMDGSVSDRPFCFLTLCYPRFEELTSFRLFWSPTESLFRSLEYTVVSITFLCCPIKFLGKQNNVEQLYFWYLWSSTLSYSTIFLLDLFPFLPFLHSFRPTSLQAKMMHHSHIYLFHCYSFTILQVLFSLHKRFSHGKKKGQQVFIRLLLFWISLLFKQVFFWISHWMWLIQDFPLPGM